MSSRRKSKITNDDTSIKNNPDISIVIPQNANLVEIQSNSEKTTEVSSDQPINTGVNKNDMINANNMFIYKSPLRKFRSSKHEFDIDGFSPLNSPAAANLSNINPASTSYSPSQYVEDSVSSAAYMEALLSPASSRLATELLVSPNPNDSSSKIIHEPSSRDWYDSSMAHSHEGFSGFQDQFIFDQKETNSQQTASISESFKSQGIALPKQQKSNIESENHIKNNELLNRFNPLKNTALSSSIQSAAKSNSNLKSTKPLDSSLQTSSNKLKSPDYELEKSTKAVLEALANISTPSIPLKSSLPSTNTIHINSLNKGFVPTSSSTPSISNLIICHCKRSRCLKLYCDCFKIKKLCESSCRCNDCANSEQFNNERQQAISGILERNVSAFDPKVDAGTVHISGCHCKKSNCLKKYCECFTGSVLCTDKCRCVECKNNSTIMEKPSIMSYGSTTKSYGLLPTSNRINPFFRNSMDSTLYSTSSILGNPNISISASFPSSTASTSSIGMSNLSLQNKNKKNSNVFGIEASEVDDNIHSPKKSKVSFNSTLSPRRLHLEGVNYQTQNNITNDNINTIEMDDYAYLSTLGSPATDARLASSKLKMNSSSPGSDDAKSTVSTLLGLAEIYEKREAVEGLLSMSPQRKDISDSIDRGGKLSKNKIIANNLFASSSTHDEEKQDSIETTNIRIEENQQSNVATAKKLRSRNARI